MLSCQNKHRKRSVLTAPIYRVATWPLPNLQYPPDSSAASFWYRPTSLTGNVCPKSPILPTCLLQPGRPSPSQLSDYCLPRTSCPPLNADPRVPDHCTATNCSNSASAECPQRTPSSGDGPRRPVSRWRKAAAIFNSWDGTAQIIPAVIWTAVEDELCV